MSKIRVRADLLSARRVPARSVAALGLSWAAYGSLYGMVVATVIVLPAGAICCMARWLLS